MALDADQLAQALLAAEAQRKPLEPFTDVHSGLTVDIARSAQELAVRSRLDRGEQVVGIRIAFTSAATREASGIDEPVSGVLTSGMLLAPGEPLDLDALIEPRAEPALALLLGRDLTGPTTVAGVLAATEAVLAAVDVVDSRYRDHRYRRPDVVADNASAGRVALGTVAARPADLVELRLIGCVLRADGAVAATAAGAAALGHPAAAVAWYLRGGNTLPAGSLVLTGGLTRAQPVRGDHSVTVEFDGLGAIEVHA